MRRHIKGREEGRERRDDRGRTEEKQGTRKKEHARKGGRRQEGEGEGEGDNKNQNNSSLSPAVCHVAGEQQFAHQRVDKGLTGPTVCPRLEGRLQLGL